MKEIDMLKCGNCGAAAKRYDLCDGEEVLNSIASCQACVEQGKFELARVRPIFDAMIEAGIDRVLANNTMTFMLENMSDIPQCH